MATSSFTSNYKKGSIYSMAFLKVNLLLLLFRGEKDNVSCTLCSDSNSVSLDCKVKKSKIKVKQLQLY
jgi:hypothetical protein